MGRATPELVAMGAGFAVLAPQRDCEPGSPRCLDAPVIPTLVRTDARLAPVQREPLGFGADPASMAWGMSCAHELCLLLAASGSAPARVRAAEVRVGANVSAAAAAPAPPPTVRASATSSRSPPAETVVDLAVAHIADATIVGTLGMKAEPPGAKAKIALDDARNAPLVLSTRVVDAAGVVSPPVVVTTRALAVGGVAMAAAEKPEDGAAVAWVARDNGDPEVHVTQARQEGEEGRTTSSSPPPRATRAMIAIVWAGGGWVVAWVDGRDGNGEVYATRLGMDLSRTRASESRTPPATRAISSPLARG